MSGYSNPIVGGGGGLVYPSIHSPNFNVANPAASPNPSWGILKNGLAYFFGLILAGGTITGPDYIINPLGAFFYSGPPATGNLIASIAPQPGVNDGKGNAFQQGITSYPGGVSAFVSMVAGQINFKAASSAVAGAINDGGTGTMGFQSSQSAAGDTPAAMQLLSKLETRGGTAPELIVFNGTQAQAPIVAEDPVALANTDEIWHPFTMINGDYTSFGELPAYRLMPDGMVEIAGIVQFNTGGGVGLSGNNPFTTAIPAPYRPAVVKNMWAYINGGNGNPTISPNTLPFVQMSSGGVLSIHNVNSTSAAGDLANFGFSGRYSLTNP